MNNKKRKKELSRIIRNLWLLLILFTLWVTASYTWFSISRTPKVSEMAISVAAQSGMELSEDLEAEEWTQHLNLAESIGEVAPLKPVTWVDSLQKFYAADIGTDGRIVGITRELSDEFNANQNNSNGFYLKHTLYARTGTNVSVSLVPAMTSGDGIEGSGTYVIGTPEWDLTAIIHNNGGNGAEYTLRVGIRITKLDADKNELADSVQFYIYEPNIDGHVDGTEEPVETKSIDGNDTLVAEEYMIRQTKSTWTEVDPVQHGVVMQSLGEFESDTHLFDLEKDTYAKIELYFWMEGQDVDCNYMIGQDAHLMANIQFYAEALDDSGLEEFR